MRQDFGWPGVTGGSTGGSSPELWIPGAARDIPRTPADNPAENLSGDRNLGILRMVARLRDGVTLEQARREADVLAARLAEGVPGQRREPRRRHRAAARAIFRSGDPPARSAAGGGRIRPGNRVRQCRQPAARPGHVTTPRNRRPSCARRDPRPHRSPVAHRSCRSLDCRQRRGAVAGLVGGSGPGRIDAGRRASTLGHAHRSCRSRVHPGRCDCNRPRLRSAAGVAGVAVLAERRPARRRCPRLQRHPGAADAKLCWSRSRSPLR